MQHHPIFDKFEPQSVVGTGEYMFDFLGAATDVAFKKGWEKRAIPKGRRHTYDYPPVNEHYFDWITLLQAVDKASGTLRIAELGAGWGPWLVRGALAAKQRANITDVQLLAVEADPTHYGWIKKHFMDNAILPSSHHIIHGAVAAAPQIFKFPKIDNPDEDYGASLQAAQSAQDYIEVQGYTLPDLISRFDGPIDFMHADIQGAEYDVFPPNMDLMKKHVKYFMVGTHLANSKHDEFEALFKSRGWKVEMSFPRMQLSATEYGDVQFGDGFLFLKNLDF